VTRGAGSVVDCRREARAALHATDRLRSGSDSTRAGVCSIRHVVSNAANGFRPDTQGVQAIVATGPERATCHRRRREPVRSEARRNLRPVILYRAG